MICKFILFCGVFFTLEHLAFNFLFSGSQWEAKVTQYERDFERVSATVRKEVIRFEVRVSDQAASLQNCWGAL